MSTSQDQLKDNLQKLHFLKSTFSHWVGEDPFLAEQLMQAIEASFSSQNECPTLEEFREAAMALSSAHSMNRSQMPTSIVLDFAEREWTPLFAQTEIIELLKKSAGKPNVFIVIRGLKDSLMPDSGYFTKARRRQYEEAVELINHTVAKWATPSSKVHLICS